jgi:hypothetical protein
MKPVTEKGREEEGVDIERAGFFSVDQSLSSRNITKANMSIPSIHTPVPDTSIVNPGLQPLLITLLYLFPGLALLVLIIRFWKKSIDCLLGGGKTH